MNIMSEIDELRLKISQYEKPGAAALFYALNRKMNEIAALLNKVTLKDVDMASKSDATFERVFKLLEKSEGISTAAKALGEFAGVTHDEEKDLDNPKFRITTPESVANEIGDNKAHNV